MRITRPEKRTKVNAISINIFSSVPDSIKNVFEDYSSIQYLTFNDHLAIDSWEILKLRINNIYTYFCDPSCCFDKEYFKNIMTPKKIYIDQLSHMTTHDEQLLRSQCDEALISAAKIFEKSAKYKIKMSWPEFEYFILKKLFLIFSNYKQYTWGDDQTTLLIDFVDQDRQVVSYIYKSLKGYMINEQWNYYQIPRGHEVKPCPTCRIGIVKKNTRRKNCFICENTVKTSNVLICENCKQKYVASPKSRKNHLCPSCYIEYRRRKEAERFRERRIRIRTEKARTQN